MPSKHDSRGEAVFIIGFGVVAGALGYSLQTYFAMWLFFWRDTGPFWPIDLSQRMFWWTMPVGAILGFLTAKSITLWRDRRYLTAAWISEKTGGWAASIMLLGSVLYLITDPHRDGWMPVIGNLLALSVSWGLPFWWGLVLLWWSRRIKREIWDWKAHQAMREYFKP